MKGVLTLLAAGLLCGLPVGAQPPRDRPAAPSGKEDALDPSPIDPATDPDIDKFLNDWRNAKPRTEYGALIFHDILTKLDTTNPVRPIKRGAVLTAITAVSYVTLAPGRSATGRAPTRQREIFFAITGTGQLTVNAKPYAIKDGTGFTLTPDFTFTLTNSGKVPLAFYVRTEPVPADTKPEPDVTVVNRFDNDRRIGAHWVHICNGGPNGMNLCTIAPHTMPQPHSHPGEEAWILVKGESVLSLGKNIIRMHPGQAYKIPPTGLTAHSNLNMGEEPIEMIYMGPANRANNLPGTADYARLDNSPIDPAAAPDIDMFMGNWHDAYPRITHGNLYVRDMLTALQGSDPQHPTRKGAVLVNAQAVSYAMLEPGSTAHKTEGDPSGVQEVFVVNSGTGTLTAGSRRVDLAKGMAFIVTPGLDFRLTATGADYMTFYVVSQKVPDGTPPRSTLAIADHRTAPRVTTAWVDQERPIMTRSDGLLRFGALTDVELKPLAMSRPASSGRDNEEIWIATDDVDILFGKQLRHIAAGTAYRVPSTGITAHANINLSDKPAHFISMVK